MLICLTLSFETSTTTLFTNRHGITPPQDLNIAVRTSNLASSLYLNHCRFQRTDCSFNFSLAVLFSFKQSFLYLLHCSLSSFLLFFLLPFNNLSFYFVVPIIPTFPCICSLIALYLLPSFVSYIFCWYLSFPISPFYYLFIYSFIYSFIRSFISSLVSQSSFLVPSL